MTAVKGRRAPYLSTNLLRKNFTNHFLGTKLLFAIWRLSFHHPAYSGGISPDCKFSACTNSQFQILKKSRNSNTSALHNSILHPPRRNGSQSLDDLLFPDNVHSHHNRANRHDNLRPPHALLATIIQLLHIYNPIDRHHGGPSSHATGRPAARSRSPNHFSQPSHHDAWP